jgi:hypothetical protein
VDFCFPPPLTGFLSKRERLRQRGECALVLAHTLEGLREECQAEWPVKFRAGPVPLTQPLSDHCHRLNSRALHEQRPAAQNAGVDVQTEALFGCHGLGSIHPLQDHVWLSPQLM